MSIPAFNVKEVEPTNPKDAFVTAICPIIAVSFAVMHASCRQVCQPPQQQKENEQETIDAIQRANVAGFPIPSSAFGILIRSLYPPSKPILGNAALACTPIRNHDQRLFFGGIPKETEFRFNRLVLPQAY